MRLAVQAGLAVEEDLPEVLPEAEEKGWHLQSQARDEDRVPKRVRLHTRPRVHRDKDRARHAQAIDPIDAP